MDSKIMNKLRARWLLRNAFSVGNQEAVDQQVCSLFGWAPRWLQPFNNMKVFMVCLVCGDIFRGIYQSNFSVMIPSITRRFGLSSESIGTLKAMNDVSHLLVALFIAHYGGSSHRPRWMACGLLLVGIGILLMAAPEIMFPADTYTSYATPASSSLRPTRAVNSTGGKPRFHLSDEMCDPTRNISFGFSERADCSKPKTDHINPLIVMGVAEFIIGLGSTTTRILGLPFVDDNVTSKNSPIYFAISFSGFVFGPLLGIALSSYFTTIHFDFKVPGFGSSDPRWIAAWFLGFLISGLGVCFFALLFSCFPSKIKNRNRSPSISDTKKAEVDGNTIRRLSMAIGGPDQKPDNDKNKAAVTLKELPRSLKNLLTNKIYVISLLNNLISSFVLAGYMSFMQMFLRQQYQLPQSVSSSAGGIPPIVTGFIGIFFGSFMIRRFRFRPTQVALMMAVSSLVGASCYLGVIPMGCESQAIVGLDRDESTNSTLSDSETCYLDHSCKCEKWQFVPVCNILTNTTYLSPCYAGCRRAERVNGRTVYHGCSCAWHGPAESLATRQKWLSSPARSTPSNSTNTEAKIVSGMCKPNCMQSFIGYVLLMCAAKFFMGIPLAGILMLQFRIVEPHEKSMANAVTTVVTSALGMLPAPIVAGKLIDAACLLWQRSPCGHHGACWIYDMDLFRFRLHALVGLARFISFFLDLTIAYLVRHITFDREADETKAGVTSTIERRATMLVATSQITLVESEELNRSENDPENDTGTVKNRQPRKSLVFQLDGEKME